MAQSISPVGSFEDPTSVPTLRVMRLQRPALHQSAALDTRSALHNSFCLPDSLSVYVGETFTAYLGVLNISATTSIRRLTVSATLQTPSTRWQLPSALQTPADVAAHGGVDAIVSHAILEAGQHILRVEVGYATADGGTRTFRKFYRFQVVHPIAVTHRVVRTGDSTGFVSLSVQYNLENNNAKVLGPITLANVELEMCDGLVAHRVAPHGEADQGKGVPEKPNALQLFDKAGVLLPGSCINYVFRVEAQSNEAKAKGIGAGDVLGHAACTWRKSMGEMGRWTTQTTTSPIVCPPVQPDDDPHFVVHGSGFSADVTAAVAGTTPVPRVDGKAVTLADRYPVTVEPIRPPREMVLRQPSKVDFLVVNHSAQAMTIQVQIHLSSNASASGVAVCGNSFATVGSIPPHGGSKVVPFHFLPLSIGLHTVGDCNVVDLVTSREIPQPPLFCVHVKQQQQPESKP